MTTDVHFDSEDSHLKDTDSTDADSFGKEQDTLMEKMCPWITYDPSGKVVLVHPMVDGALHGEVQAYEEGLLLYKRQYQGGQLHGPSYDFFEGRIVLVSHYLNNQLHGLATHFAATGLIQMQLTYQQGKREGPCLLFGENGELQQYLFYQNDKKHGLWMVFFPSGRLMTRGYYVEDREEGLFEDFLDTGVCRMHRRYQYGVLREKTVFEDS